MICRFAISSHVSVFSDGTVIKVSEAFFIDGASLTRAKGAKFMGNRRENKIQNPQWIQSIGVFPNADENVTEFWEIGKKKC